MSDIVSAAPSPCPECGELQAPAAVFCAHCGAPLRLAKDNRGWVIVGKVVVSLMLFTSALGLGTVGACLSLMDVVGGGSSTIAVVSSVRTYYGLAALLAVLGVAWLVFWERKR